MNPSREFIDCGAALDEFSIPSVKDRLEMLRMEAPMLRVEALMLGLAGPTFYLPLQLQHSRLEAAPSLRTKLELGTAKCQLLSDRDKCAVCVCEFLAQPVVNSSRTGYSPLQGLDAHMMRHQLEPHAVGIVRIDAVRERRAEDFLDPMWLVLDVPPARPLLGEVSRPPLAEDLTP